MQAKRSSGSTTTGKSVVKKAEAGEKQATKYVAKASDTTKGWSVADFGRKSQHWRKMGYKG
jgi:hypothetical protein